MRGSVVRTATRLACCGYWVLLTVLLLVPNPAVVVGLQERPVFPWGGIGTHFLAFTLLSVLVHSARWPRRPTWSTLVLLVGYGITTEWLQNFVPPRSARFMDGTENVLGVVAGLAVYWIVRQWLRR